MITPRLEAIVNLVQTKTIADIGTDHAYIPIYLASKNRITKAVASDKNKGPIERARENVKKYGLSQIIDLRIGQGLSPIEKGEAETIIIAGMGGVLIGDIIEADLEKAYASRLILQPMNAQDNLRKRLLSLGFIIEEEELSCEGFKVYNLMSVKKGIAKEDEPIYYYIPKSLLGHELCPMLINKKEREFLKIINGQKNSNNPDKIIIKEYEALLKDLEKLKRDIKH